MQLTSRSSWARALRVVFLVGLCAPLASLADIFYVNASSHATPGADDPLRNGSASQPWASLKYAVDRVQALSTSGHTIRLSAGTFQMAGAMSNPSDPASTGTTGRINVTKPITIEGNGSTGSAKTRIQAPLGWDLSNDTNTSTWAGFMFRIGTDVPVANIAVRGIEFVDTLGKKTNGVFLVTKGQNIVLENNRSEGFRFAAIHALYEGPLFIRGSHFLNNGKPITSSVKSSAIKCVWIKDSEIANNTFQTTVGGSYGYKAAGQRNVKIYGNDFNLFAPSDFDIEIAHEHEYGVDIYNNTFRNTVSLPKSGNQSNPAVTYPNTYYSIRVRDNSCTAGWFIEGPRNYLEVRNNHVVCTDTTTNYWAMYSDHGGVSGGPVWIHHNVIEAVDRNLLYVTGDKDNIHLYNNVIYTSAQTRQLIKLGLDSSTTGWTIANNIIVTDPSVTCYLIEDHADRLSSPVVTNNVYQNITMRRQMRTGVYPNYSYPTEDLSAGNTNAAPQIGASGAKPYPYYAPATASANNLVGTGAVLGFTDPLESYLGSGPDVGAYEAALGSDDTFARSGTYASQTYGAATTLSVKNDSGDYSRESFVRFDLSNLANVSTARLVLPVLAAGPVSSANTYELVDLDSSAWSETTLNWSNRPTAGTSVGNFTVAASHVGSDIVLDVTDRVRARLGGAIAFRVRSTTAGADRWFNFGSKENATPANSVRLEVMP